MLNKIKNIYYYDWKINEIAYLKNETSKKINY